MQIAGAVLLTDSKGIVHKMVRQRTHMQHHSCSQHHTWPEAFISDSSLSDPPVGVDCGYLYITI